MLLKSEAACCKKSVKITIYSSTHDLVLLEGSFHPSGPKPPPQPQGGSDSASTCCHFSSPAGTASLNDTGIGI